MFAQLIHQIRFSITPRMLLMPSILVQTVTAVTCNSSHPICCTAACGVLQMQCSARLRYNCLRGSHGPHPGVYLGDVAPSGPDTAAGHALLWVALKILQAGTCLMQGWSLELCLQASMVLPWASATRL